MHWMILPYRRYFDFSGRSRRLEYWWFCVFLAVVVVAFVIAVLAAVFGTLASTQSRKAGSEVGKYRAAALWSGLALLTILLAMPWTRSLIPFVR